MNITSYILCLFLLCSLGLHAQSKIYLFSKELPDTLYHEDIEAARAFRIDGNDSITSFMFEANGRVVQVDNMIGMGRMIAISAEALAFLSGLDKGVEVELSIYIDRNGEQQVLQQHFAYMGKRRDLSDPVFEKVLGHPVIDSLNKLYCSHSLIDHNCYTTFKYLSADESKVLFSYRYSYGYNAKEQVFADIDFLIDKTSGVVWMVDKLADTVVILDDE